MPLNLLVVGFSKPLVVQVMLAAHACTESRTIAVCAPGTRYLRYSVLCAGYEEIDFSGADDSAFVAMANAYANQHKNLIVVPADCAGSRMLNRVRNLLTMRIVACPSDAALDRLEDKWNFHDFCWDLGLRTPATIYVGDKRALHFASAVARLGLPFIVKPSNEDSSRGAWIVGSEEEYNRDIRDNAAYQYRPLIAQRYIAGTDVGLNFHASHGRVTAISIQRRDDYLHDGSPIRFFAEPYLRSVADRIAAATDYDGVMNVDARIESETGKVYLFESNPRFWRSLSASVWCGLNFVEECLRDGALDEAPRLLTTGTADTFYHPLYRAAMWGDAVQGTGSRGRLARLMFLDVSIFLASSKVLATRLAKRIGDGIKKAAERRSPSFVTRLLSRVL